MNITDTTPHSISSAEQQQPPPSDFKPYLNLLKILEELFFTLTIPEDLVFKYNILKENTMAELSLPFEPITTQQYPNLKKPGI